MSISKTAWRNVLSHCYFLYTRDVISLNFYYCPEAAALTLHRTISYHYAGITIEKNVIIEKT